jgi:hypothetical protein
MARSKGLNWDKPVSVTAAGWALAITFVVLFAICLIAAQMFPGVPLAHNWVRLYSAAPMNSGQVWIEGIIASVVFGWITAIVLGLSYNRFAR